MCIRDSVVAGPNANGEMCLHRLDLDKKTRLWKKAATGQAGYLLVDPESLTAYPEPSLFGVQP